LVGQVFVRIYDSGENLVWKGAVLCFHGESRRTSRGRCTIEKKDHVEL